MLSSDRDKNFAQNTRGARTRKKREVLRSPELIASGQAVLLGTSQNVPGQQGPAGLRSLS